MNFKRTKHILACLTLLGTYGVLFSQTAKQDIIRMNQAYKDAKTFSMDVEVMLFKKASGNTAAESHKGRVKKQGNNYYTEMMGKTDLYNERCFLSVDKESQRIIYANPGTASTGLPELDMAAQLDSLLKDGLQIKTIQSTPSSKTCQVSMHGKDPYIDRVQFTIDANTAFLTQVVYYYTPGNAYEKVLINYKNIQLNNKIPLQDFSEAPFIYHKNGTVHLQPAYKDYRLVNHYHE